MDKLQGTFSPQHHTRHKTFERNLSSLIPKNEEIEPTMTEHVRTVTSALIQRYSSRNLKSTAKFDSMHEEEKVEASIDSLTLLN